MQKRKMTTGLYPLAFTGPAVFFFTLIVVIPFLMSIYYSFTNWNGIAAEADWIGFDNFRKVFAEDEGFRRSFWVTTKLAVISVIVINVIAFGLALLLTQALKLRDVFRTIFFMPQVIGGLLLGYIWYFIFTKTFSTLGKATGIGFFNLPWLGNAQTAFWAIIIVSVWQLAGYMMVIYIAALINIPQDLVEAASIDGASAWQRLRNIVIPMVMPAITVCLFLTISMSFKSFDIIIALTKGGPFKSTEVISINIYEEAFRNSRLGYATAKSFIFFLIVAAVTLIQVTITKRREVKA
ncbi:carbohydrate ABC transporter permease [Marinicrinis lubricantis]|uniref:Carbohydrate ABC transporter permease n=1 Tax=Marinicrinis lubricantis TaxID=2086470 RepID=A0ABW1IQP8_9BACL